MASIFGNNRINDVLVGTSTSDYIYGYGGDDTLEGKGGADYLYGGDGIDTATYAHSSAGVQINLAAAVQHGGDAEGDQLFSIENIIGSSYKDVLTGNSGNNRLEGGGGTDTLSGGDGADVLDGGDGNDMLISSADGALDLLIGGAGTDTVSYFGSSRGLDIKLATNAGQLNAQDGTATAYATTAPTTLPDGSTGTIFLTAFQEDTLRGVENVIGSSNADFITGNEQGNRLEGGAGNDVIKGEGGSDTILPGLGEDHLYGGFGADVFVFTSVLDSGVASTPLPGGGFSSVVAIDIIHDFETEFDVLNLSAIDADTTAGHGGDQAFHWVDQFTGAGGELRYTATDWGAQLDGDVNGDGDADFTLVVASTSVVNWISPSDVIL